MKEYAVTFTQDADEYLIVAANKKEAETLAGLYSGKVVSRDVTKWTEN